MGDEHNGQRSSSSCADRGGEANCKLSAILDVRVDSLETQVSAMNHAVTQMILTNERISSNIITISESDRHHGLAIDGLIIRIAKLEDNSSKFVLDLKDVQNGLTISANQYQTNIGHIKRLAKSFLELEKTYKLLEQNQANQGFSCKTLASQMADVMGEVDGYPDAELLKNEINTIKFKLDLLETANKLLSDSNLEFKATTSTTRNIAIGIGALATFISTVIAIMKG